MLLTSRPDDKPTAAPEQSMLLRLRLAAQKCSNVEYRLILRTAADDLDAALIHVYAEITEERVRNLNNAWAFAARVLKNTPPEGGTAPLGGSTRPTLFETSPAAMRRAA